MIFPKSIILALAALVAPSVNAFQIVKPSVAFHAGQVASTCLYAEEEGEAGTEADTSSTDILNSPEFLRRKLDVIKSDIAQAEADIAVAQEQAEAGKAEWGPQMEALQSEYKNIQDRMSSQGGQQNTMATTVVVREMLELLDNFDRAFGVIKPETEEEEAIDAAYKELYQSVLDKFAELGVEQVETVGTEFDYEVHQAVMQRPSEDYEEGMVCEEFQKGFKIEETLIRAAMVVVAA
mmetsp:Transcript_18499/g.45832  ORF Transcript_18499/g.45832 Transcript_18499/m.45832 type:complete len:236 (-) Transcript_18499:55-762(-)|eukprot:CAMPEP_0113632184 /NCGR_PEP_ID=MMETSP0017_2-20120614/16725_1 /TAXON_ID=2856 /ORGANISM="Cylindrotheca closterium" /LENGTH=235 /DNA_ID=CAMNT_0000542723 /DNA_START=48 /DNA_END=755 /DNA_ORIENTATION=+ /assembly_acc=CAM_ASM_000147